MSSSHEPPNSSPVPDIASEELLARFDKLRKDGAIFWGSSVVIRPDDQSFPLEFSICPALATKPNIPDFTTTEHSSGETNTSNSTTGFQKWGPGSDINRGFPDELITTVRGTHHLIFNKFCVQRPQYMLITTDSYARQSSALNHSDFEAAWEVLDATGEEDGSSEDWIVFYNCGEDAGCSRVHKHLQIVRKPQWELWPDKLNRVTRRKRLRPELELMPIAPIEDESAVGEELNLPFQYFIYTLDPYFQLESDMVDEQVQNYNIMLDDLGRDPKSDQPFPHNVLLTRNWLVVVPRSKAGVDGLYANALKMVGMMWDDKMEATKAWLEKGPKRVLSELGIPPTEEGDIVEEGWQRAEFLGQRIG